MTVALAPDWTITGSDSLLEELVVARAYWQEALAGRITPRQLFKMATCDAARVAGVSERLGRIAFGFAAEMFLAPKLENDPFESLLKTTPRDIQLVFINGSPVYGDRQIMRPWVPADALDDVRVEGVKKSLHLVGAPGEDEPLRFREIEATLRKALPRLAPLVEDNR